MGLGKGAAGLRSAMLRARRFTARALLALGLLWAHGTAAERQEAGTPYNHEAFTVTIPPGWGAVANPSKPAQVRFTDGQSPPAMWMITARAAPPGLVQLAGKPEVKRRISENLEAQLRKAFPVTTKLSPQKRTLPGTTMAHLLFQLQVRESPFLLEGVHILAGKTIYFVQFTMPTARKAAVEPAADVLFRTFRPKAAPGLATGTTAQGLQIVRNALAKLTRAMPPEWRPVIAKVKIVPDAPKRGEVTLLTEAQWPRRELRKEFAAAKATLDKEAQGEPVSPADPQGIRTLINHAGRLLGAGYHVARGLEPPATHLTLRLLDAAGAEAGTMRMRTSDFTKLASGQATPRETARMFELILPER